MINKENDIRADTHMKWRDFGSESPSGLHCTNRYKSPDHPMGLIFESPVYRVHNDHKFGLGLGLLLPVQTAWTSLDRCNMQPNTWTHTNIHSYTDTPHTYTNSCIYQAYTLHICTRIQHTLMHTPNKCIHPHKHYICTNTHPITHALNHTHTW